MVWSVSSWLNIEERINNKPVELRSQQIINKITLTRSLLVHSLVFKYHILITKARHQSAKMELRRRKNIFHQPSSQRFLTWNVPGTVVFTPAGFC